MERYNMMAFLSMVVVQVGHAGLGIISKLAMDSGMNPFVHVAYRQLFVTLAIAPFAYVLERKTRPKMTLSILIQIFLCSFGVTLHLITIIVGIHNSTPTITSALFNLNPAVTFILAILFRQEKLRVKTKAGQAKIVGTALCIGGALLLSFYQGPIVNIGQSSIHWKYAEKSRTKNSINAHVNIILGPFLIVLSAVFWAIYLIIQTRVSQKYDAPWSSSTIMCAMASVQCVVVGFAFNHSLVVWSLSSSIRLVSTLYAGIVCSALTSCLISWCIKKKGALYVSVFIPLQVVIVAILSWALLEEKLCIGIVVGSVLIVLGLYGVLWGKKEEANCTHMVEEEVYNFR